MEAAGDKVSLDRSRARGGKPDRTGRQGDAGRRRDRTASPPVSARRAFRGERPAAHAPGRAAVVRRRVARALRRHAPTLPESHSRRSSTSWTNASPVAVRWSTATRHGASRSSFPTTKLDQRLHDRHRRLPRADDASASPAAGGRKLHRRVRDRQVVERLQLVPGRIPQPDPGEHRSADLHRPRGRPRLPRGLSRAPRLQRPAREASRAGSRLDRVHRLSPVLSAVAHRRRHGQLRDRGRIPGRASGWRSKRRCSSPPPASTPRRARRVLRGAGAGGAARLRRQRGGAPLHQQARSTPARRPPGSSNTR